VNQFTKEDPMSLVTTDSPTRDRAIQDHDAADHADRGHREPRPSRISVLLEALAYAGASIDPAAALAAQRFARIRDQERRRGRW
jgi:hypothetical protein